MRQLKRMKDYVEEKVLRSYAWVQTLRNEKGQGLIEYALIAALIAVIAILALTFLGLKVSNTLNKVGGNL